MQLENGVRQMIVQCLRGIDFDCNYSLANSEGLCLTQALVAMVMASHTDNRCTILCRIYLHPAYAKFLHVALSPVLTDNYKNSN